MIASGSFTFVCSQMLVKEWAWSFRDGIGWVSREGLSIDTVRENLCLHRNDQNKKKNISYFGSTFGKSSEEYQQCFLCVDSMPMNPCCVEWISTDCRILLWKCWLMTLGKEKKFTRRYGGSYDDQSIRSTQIRPVNGLRITYVDNAQWASTVCVTYCNVFCKRNDPCATDVERRMRRSRTES